MKKRVLLSMSLLVSIPTDFYGLTLDEVLVNTYQTNPTIVAAREQLKFTDETYYQAVAGWLPSVKANLSYGRGNISTGNLTGRGGIEDRAITATQPVFNGGASVFALRKAIRDIDAGKAALNNTEQETLFLAVSSYMQVLKKQESLKISDYNVNALSKHLENTMSMHKLGSANRTDVSQAKARYSNAISEKIFAEGELEKEKSNFKRITGLDPVDLIDPQNEESLSLSPALEVMIDKALVNNPNLIAATKAYEAANESKKAAFSSILPSVGLEYTYAKSKSPSLSFNSQVNSQTYLVNVSVPLYQAGTEYSKVRQTEDVAQSLKAQRDSAKNDVVDAVIAAWNDKEVAFSTITSASDSVEAGKDALDGVSKEYYVGSRTSLDVLDTEQDLYDAKLALVSAKINYYISQYQLKALIGELTPEKINLGIKNYDPDYHLSWTKFKFIGF
jgi:outer membrane protein